MAKRSKSKLQARRRHAVPVRSRSFYVWVTVGIAAGLAVLTLVIVFFSLKGKPDSVVQRITTKVARAMVSPELVFGGRDRLNILVLGVDVNRDRRGQPTKELARTDTIMVVGLDRYFKTVRVLSLPRDTLVEIPGQNGWHKINAAHALGGPEGVERTIEENFHLRVHHYIRTDFGGFVELVDALGGVELLVEKDMDYDDNWGQLHIHLKKGQQVLDGDKAHQYVRFRHDTRGDLGRIERQQKLLRAIVQKILTPEGLTKLPDLADIAYQHITTDLKKRELLSLAMFLKEIRSEDVETASLPVYSEGHGLWPQPQEARKLLREMFGASFNEREWDRYWEERKTRPLPKPKPSPLQELEEPSEEVEEEPFPLPEPEEAEAQTLLEEGKTPKTGPADTVEKTAPGETIEPPQKAESAPGVPKKPDLVSPSPPGKSAMSKTDVTGEPSVPADSATTEPQSIPAPEGSGEEPGPQKVTEPQ